MKKTVLSIQHSCNAIGSLKSGDLEASDKYKIIKAVRALKPISEEFDKFIDQARETAKNNAEFNKLVNEEAMNEVDVPEYVRVSDETFDKIMKANPDLTFSQLMYIEDFLK